ncbi:hypothetical protein [Flavobacterium sp. GNP002]
MAAQGTFTAYRQLKPLQGDVSQDILAQEELGLQRRAEKRQIDQIAQQKVDKKAAEKKELYNKYAKNLDNYDTGSKSLTEVQGRLLIEAKKEYVPLMAILNNPNSSDEEVLKATLKLENINRLPEKMLTMTKALTERDLAIKKGVAEGRLFANPEYDQNFQEGWENKSLALDENGEIVALFNNPDGTKDFETYNEFLNTKKYDFTQRFDRDKELLEASTKLQPETNQTDDGTKRVKTTAINPELLKEYVSNQLFEADGVTPTQKMKSFAKEQGVDFSDVKGLQKIASDFENDIRLRVKGGTEVTRNYNNLDVQKEANDERERRRRAAQENTEKPTISYVERINNASPSLADSFSFSTPYQLKDKKSSLGKDGFISGITTSKSGMIFLKGEQKIGTRKKEEDGVEITEDAWKSITIKDKQEVQSILGGTLGTKSYEETLKVLNDIKSKNSRSANTKSKKESAAQRALRIANGG